MSELCILNIGLGRASMFPESAVSEVKNLKTVARALQDTGLADRAAELHTSPEGEHTVVMTLHLTRSDETFALLTELSKLCRQDCIAAYWPESEYGGLFGPYPGPWQPFDLRFFIQPSYRLGGLLVNVQETT